MPSHVKLNVRTIDGLLEAATDRIRDDGRLNFRVVCLTSDLPREEIENRFESGFAVSNKGELTQLSTSYTKYHRKFEVYLYLYIHDETGAPLIFTLNSSEDVRRTANPIIESFEGLYHLWFPPDQMDAIMEDTLEFEGSQLVEFVGEKFGRERRHTAERRPEFERREQYSGKDAAQTLEEWKQEYGITPTKLDFRIPTKSDFHFNNEGAFVMKSGDARFFFEIVTEVAIPKVVEMNQTIQSSKLDVVEIEGLEMFEGDTLEIELSTSFDYDDRDELLGQMRDNEFYPYNVSTAPGSLLLNGRIVDEENGGMLSITSDGKVMSVLPKHGSSFDSVMRFYRFVIERIDSEADFIA